MTTQISAFLSDQFHISSQVTTIPTGSKQTSDTIQDPTAKKCIGKAVRKGMLVGMGISP